MHRPLTTFAVSEDLKAALIAANQLPLPAIGNVFYEGSADITHLLSFEISNEFRTTTIESGVVRFDCVDPSDMVQAYADIDLYVPISNTGPSFTDGVFADGQWTWTIVRDAVEYVGVDVNKANAMAKAFIEVLGSL